MKRACTYAAQTYIEVARIVSSGETNGSLAVITKANPLAARRRQRFFFFFFPGAYSPTAYAPYRVEITTAVVPCSCFVIRGNFAVSPDAGLRAVLLQVVLN